VTSAPFTLRSGTAEVRVHAVVVQESHTLVGKSSWLNVVKASLVNLGSGPLRWDDLSGAFKMRTLSGAEIRGYVSPSGNAGWKREEQTGGQPHLPPGAAGEIRVQFEPNNGSTRDDPASIWFKGQTVELR